MLEPNYDRLRGLDSQLDSVGEDDSNVADLKNIVRGLLDTMLETEEVEPEVVEEREEEESLAELLEWANDNLSYIGLKCPNGEYDPEWVVYDGAVPSRELGRRDGLREALGAAREEWTRIREEA